MFADFWPYYSFLVSVFDKPQGISENFIGTRKPWISYLSSCGVSALE